MTPEEQYQKEAKELYTMPVMPAEFNSSEEHEAFNESCEWQRQRRAAYIAGRTKSEAEHDQFAIDLLNHIATDEFQNYARYFVRLNAQTTLDHFKSSRLSEPPKP